MGIYRFMRDSLAGRVIYHISAHKYFSHDEESKDYIIAEKYLSKEVIEVVSDIHSSSSTLSDNKILVDWEGEDDPENPHNWPLWEKVLLLVEICFLTTVVYMSSAIYTPGIQIIMEELGVTRVKATLPLTMFVIGYGLGTMVFSPMSENALFGRTYIYISTLAVFFFFQIPISLVNDMTTLTILRFFSGLFASPALAIGGASAGDTISFKYLPIGIVAWAASAAASPTLSPMIGSILIVKRDWHWTFWLVAMTSGTILLTFTFLLPETSEKKLLARKAQRLRKLTGNQNIISQGELENANITTKQLISETLWRPIAIILFEPVVLLIDMYIALVYSIIYLWFEAFPIVYGNTYHFALIPLGVTFVSVNVGVVLGAIGYILYTYKFFTLPLLRNETVHPEVVIPPMIVASILMPIGVLIFGWTASPDLPWFPPLIGAGIFGISGFIIFQTGFNYLAMSFPDYLASVFAGNNFFRSVIAGCFPLFGAPLFNNLATKKFPVAWGSSVIGLVSIVMILIPVLFYMNGPKLRARSKFSSSVLETKDETKSISASVA